jgi:hypothetical protein
MMVRYQHQQTALDLLSQNDVFALILEQGTGKSRPIVEDWYKRATEGREQDLVVIAPKGCYLNWIGTSEEPGELTKWLPPDFVYYAAPWISGGNKTQMKALDDLLYAKGPRFLCINVEALNRPGKAREYIHKFIDGHKVIGVIDESTTIAHDSAARTKFILKELAHRFTSRRILSGLVAPESPMDLYTQYAYLNKRIIGQPSYYGFRNRYAIIQRIDFTPKHLREEGKQFKEVPVIVGFRNLEELNRLIMAKSYRVTKDQVLDLPPKIYQFWDVEMTQEQDRIYTQMKNVAMAQLSDGLFSSATMKLDQLGKMQHILCGHVRDENGELVDIPENRTDAVIEILHQHNGKAIIWAPYPQALRKITAKLRKEFGEDSTVTFWGETTLDERVEARNKIQNEDACRFIVSNQSVGKFGNTWTACNLVIYYANSFDNEDRQQSEDRAHRIGQTKYVTYIDLRVRGTIDQRLIDVLRQKITISSTIQGDSFRQWLV